MTAASTALIIGAVGAVWSLAWVFNWRDWPSHVLRWFYRTAGTFLWPWGDEDSYVTFMRTSAWLAVVGFAALFALGVSLLVTR